MSSHVKKYRLCRMIACTRKIYDSQWLKKKCCQKMAIMHPTDTIMSEMMFTNSGRQLNDPRQSLQSRINAYYAVS